MHPGAKRQRRVRRAQAVQIQLRQLGRNHVALEALRKPCGWSGVPSSLGEDEIELVAPRLAHRYPLVELARAMLAKRCNGRGIERDHTPAARCLRSRRARANPLAAECSPARRHAKR